MEWLLFLVASGFRMMRSTTASTVWFLRLSRRMPSVSSVIAPSMRARNPCWSSASSSSRNSPLRPRTSGAYTVIRSPDACATMRSTICSAVWRVIGSPHLGQCGWPTDAYSRRR